VNNVNNFVLVWGGGPTSCVGAPTLIWWKRISADSLPMEAVRWNKHCWRKRYTKGNMSIRPSPIPTSGTSPKKYPNFIADPREIRDTPIPMSAMPRPITVNGKPPFEVVRFVPTKEACRMLGFGKTLMAAVKKAMGISSSHKVNPAAIAEWYAAHPDFRVREAYPKMVSRPRRPQGRRETAVCKSDAPVSTSAQQSDAPFARSPLSGRAE